MHRVQHMSYATLPLIYDTATALGRWRRALDAVAADVDAKAIAMLIRRPDPSARDLNMLTSNYLKFTRTAGGIYYGLWLSRLQDPDWDYLSLQPAHQPTPDTTIGPPPDALDARADYAFLRKKLGVRRRMGIRLNSDKVWFDAMSIAFDADLPDVPNAAMAKIQPLLPHLTKAVELGRVFQQLKNRYAAVLSALDHVRVGIAIALPTGELVVENEEARRIFDQRDGVWKKPDGHLTCHQPDQGAALAHAVLQAASTATGTADQAEQLLAIQRKSDADPYLVDVAPLRDPASEIDAGLDGALITIIDPDHLPQPKMNRFVALYGLTEAEADVCEMAIHGLSLNEIAERRDTSPTTAKNQVASILQKCGVRRRAELIRLVIRVLPPVG